MRNAVARNLGLVAKVLTPEMARSNLLSQNALETLSLNFEAHTDQNVDSLQQMIHQAVQHPLSKSRWLVQVHNQQQFQQLSQCAAAH
jgi:hypothetical protein